MVTGAQFEPAVGALLDHHALEGIDELLTVELRADLLQGFDHELGCRVAEEGGLGGVLVIELVVLGDEGLVLRGLGIVEQIVAGAVDSFGSFHAVGLEDGEVDCRMLIEGDCLGKAGGLGGLLEADDARARVAEDQKVRLCRHDLGDVGAEVGLSHLPPGLAEEWTLGLAAFRYFQVDSVIAWPYSISSPAIQYLMKGFLARMRPMALPAMVVFSSTEKT